MSGSIWIIEEGGKATGDLLLPHLPPGCLVLSLPDALERLGKRGKRPSLILLEGFPGSKIVRDITLIKELFPEGMVFLISNWNHPEETNRLFSRSLFKNMRPPNSPLELQNSYHLTEREFEVLKCMVNGLIKKEIAEHLSISYHTVDNHQRNIFRKLNVHTRSAAVAKALMEKLC